MTPEFQHTERPSPSSLTLPNAITLPIPPPQQYGYPIAMPSSPPPANNAMRSFHHLRRVPPPITYIIVSSSREIRPPPTTCDAIFSTIYDAVFSLHALWPSLTTCIAVFSSPATRSFPSFPLPPIHSYISTHPTNVLSFTTPSPSTLPSLNPPTAFSSHPRVKLYDCGKAGKL